MPNYAKDYAKEIKKDINDLNLSFNSNNDDLAEDVQLGNLDFSSSIHLLGNLIDEKGLSFASPNHQQAGKELKETINSIQGAMIVNTRADEAVDYEKWDKTMAVFAQDLTKQIREFNQNTDYNYINNGNMRLLQKFSDKLNKLVNKVATHELQEDTTKKLVDYGNVMFESDSVKRQERDVMNAFQKIGISPTQIDKVENIFAVGNKSCNQIIDNTTKEIVSDEKDLYHALDMDPKVYIKFVDKKIWDIHTDNLDIADFQKKTMQGEIKVSDILDNNSIPSDFKEAITEREQLVHFLENRPENETREQFKNALIEEDPLGLFNNGEDKINSPAAKKILSANSDKLNNIIQNKLDSFMDKVQSFDYVNRKAVRDYADYDSARKNLNIAKADRTKNEKIYNEQIEVLRNSPIGQQQPKALESYLNDAWRQAKTVTDRDVIADKKEKAQTYIDNAVKGNQKATAINNMIKAKEGLIEAGKQAINDFSEAKVQVDVAKKAQEKHEKAYDSFKQKQTEFWNKRGRKNSDFVMEKLKQNLDDYAKELLQCKRSGHKDTPEFKNMQDALNNAKENPSPDTLKALSEASEHYLTEKGTRNPFATKMRRHRIDMAKKLSEFAKEQESVFEATAESDKAMSDIGKGFNKMKDTNKPETVFSNIIKNSKENPAFRENGKNFLERLSKISHSIDAKEKARDIKVSALSDAKKTVGNKNINVPKNNEPQAGLM